MSEIKKALDLVKEGEGFVATPYRCPAGKLTIGYGRNIEANPLTNEERAQQLKAQITSAIQEMLDTKAQSLRYDNMMSARSYAGYVNPFQSEAQALAVWCAECWKKAGELEATGNVYTVEEVLAQMPVYGA